jgi:UPF0716 protein FxsA
MLPLILLLFIVVPIVELYVILQVGQAIGVVPTIVLLIADSVLGSVLMRTQGRAAWRRFNQAVGEHRIPAREVIDGVLVIFGGAFLLTPGFVTDVFGILLLLPPTRAVVRGILGRRLLPRMVGSAVGGPPPGWRRPAARGAGHDVEGTATEVDPRRLP